MTRSIPSFFFLVCLSMIAALAPAQVASTPPVSQPSLSQQLENAHLRRTLGAWWGGIAVIQHGKPVFVKGFGLENEDLRPFDADTLYDLGHLSTQFTATAVLRLEQEGKLSLSDPISKYFPKAPATIAKITLEQILRNRSGLSDKGALTGVNDTTSRDEVITGILGTTLANDPGTVFEYSQRGYCVLAGVVEIASKQPFDDYLRTHIFSAAGMKRTGFLDGVGLDRKRQCLRAGAAARGDFSRSDLFGEKPAEVWNWAVRGSSGVVSNLGDMVAWDLALRNKVILNETQIAKMFALENNNYGIAWYVNNTPRSTRYAWHGGSSRGLKALYFNYIDEDTSIIVLTNDSGIPDYTIYSLQEVLFPPLPDVSRLALQVADLPRTLDPVTGSNAAIELHDPVNWSVTSIQGGHELSLTRASDSKTIARLALSEGALRRLNSLLADVLLGKPVEDNTIPTINIVLAPHTDVPNGTLTIPNPVRVEARVLYRGLAPDKSEVVDRHPTLVVTDPATGRDPLSVRMNAKTAYQLRDTLMSVIRPTPATR